MKKLFTLALIAAGFSANAQISNAGMENWHTLQSVGVNLEAPDGWYGSDSLVIWKEDDSLGFVVTGQQIFMEPGIVNNGSFSARLETTEALTFKIPALMANAKMHLSSSFDINNPMASFQFSGGMPVTQRIEFVYAWLQYTSMDPLDDETAVFAANAYLTGIGQGGTDSLVGTGFVNVAENTSFEHKGIHLNYVNSTVVPDKLIIMFVSSDVTTGNAIDGSSLYVDDVSMSTVHVKNTAASSHTVKCFPNPATDVLNLLSATNDRLSLTIYSITGQEVLQQYFIGNGRADISRLSRGLYYYQVSNAEGVTVKQEKLVIN